jgi:hypothetical protein
VAYAVTFTCSTLCGNFSRIYIGTNHPIWGTFSGKPLKPVKRREDRKMLTGISRDESKITGKAAIVYRTVCTNPGCQFKFDLKITAENVNLLGGSIACPHCKRHGGRLKSQGRIGEQTFAAKLSFGPTGIARKDNDDELGADSNV